MVVIGVLLLVAKLAEFGPFGDWSWWIVLAPFAAAVLWWEFADTSGWTQRRIMEKLEARKIERRAKAMDSLGLTTRRQRNASEARKENARRLGETADPTQATHGADAPHRDRRS
jgi:small Trp-rich protein